MYSAEMDWNLEARRVLRAELARRDITYKRLVQLLETQDVIETDRAIANKLSRGTFSFAFFLQCMKAIGASTISLE
ncbi:MAG: DUF6471 domain-containing protein [Sterolibacterium sp.]|nr:DUF6471 domain-containing protein [Sterolibacterium sp.]